MWYLLSPFHLFPLYPNIDAYAWGKQLSRPLCSLTLIPPLHRRLRTRHVNKKSVTDRGNRAGSSRCDVTIRHSSIEDVAGKWRRLGRNSCPSWRHSHNRVWDRGYHIGNSIRDRGSHAIVYGDVTCFCRLRFCGCSLCRSIGCNSHSDFSCVGGKTADDYNWSIGE